MGRKSLSQNLSSGILSVGNVAALCDAAPQTVYKWLKNGSLEHHTREDTGEKKICAHHLMEMLKRNKAPIPRELPAAVAAFRLKYNDDLTLKKSEAAAEHEEP